MNLVSPPFSIRQILTVSSPFDTTQMVRLDVGASHALQSHNNATIVFAGVDQEFASRLGHCRKSRLPRLNRRAFDDNHEIRVKETDYRLRQLPR